MLDNSRTRTPVIGTLAVMVLLGVVALGVFGFRHWHTRGNPALVYERHTLLLTGFIERIQDGNVGKNANGDYHMPVFLDDCGATHVRQVDSCYVITFEFMPTDPVPELWCSPQGFIPLPETLQKRQSYSNFKFKQITPHWAECISDR